MKIAVSPKQSSLPGPFGSILVVSAAVFAATLLPLLLYLRRCAPLSETSLFQPDTFYYLAIARNSLHTSFYSFDGVNPTNGFHPVWEYLLYHSMRMHLLPPDNPFLTLHHLYIGNLLLLSFACALLAFFCARHLRRGWLAFLALCPGFLWFPVALTAPTYLANWSYLNGMESAIELLFLGLALLLFSLETKSPLRLPLATFFFGLMVLSRLDDVFLLLPILLLIWKPRTGNTVSRSRLVALCLPLLMIASYLIYNRISVGVFMPTSGAAKAGFALAINFKAALSLFIPWQWQQLGGGSYSEGFMRVFQMLAPMLICGIFLIKRRLLPWGVIEALCVGVLLKGAYNFINVANYHQGSWYFGSSIFLANFILALLWDETLNLAHPVQTGFTWLNISAQAFGCAALIAVTFNIYAHHFMSNPGAAWQRSILTQSNTLRQMVQHQGSDRFIDMNDGELAYSSGLQAISGHGLALDPDAANALVHGHFFEIAADRGYHLMMASGLYKDLIDVALVRHAQGARDPLFMLSPTELDQFNVTSVDYDPVSDTRLYRVSPKP